MHRPMPRHASSHAPPMHGPARPSTKTQISPHQHNTEQNYMILLLNINLITYLYIYRWRHIRVDTHQNDLSKSCLAAFKVKIKFFCNQKIQCVFLDFFLDFRKCKKLCKECCIFRQANGCCTTFPWLKYTFSLFFTTF